MTQNEELFRNILKNKVLQQVVKYCVEQRHKTYLWVPSWEIYGLIDEVLNMCCIIEIQELIGENHVKLSVSDKNIIWSNTPYFLGTIQKVRFNKSKNKHFLLDIKPDWCNKGLVELLNQELTKVDMIKKISFEKIEDNTVDVSRFYTNDLEERDRLYADESIIFKPPVSNVQVTLPDDRANDRIDSLINSMNNAWRHIEPEDTLSSRIFDIDEKGYVVIPRFGASKILANNNGFTDVYFDRLREEAYAKLDVCELPPVGTFRAADLYNGNKMFEAWMWYYVNLTIKNHKPLF